MKNTLDQHLAAYKGGNLYDFDNTIQLNWYPKRILYHSPNAKTILELGLGHGITTQYFSNYFERHVVLDGSSAVIDNFRNTFSDCKAQIIKTYFEEFQSEEKFDVIVLGFILEHVDRPFEILNRFKQFMEPNGTMFVAVPNAEVLNRRLGYIAGLLNDMQELSDHDRLCGHKRYYTVRSLTNEATQSGFEVCALEGIYLKPFTTNQMMSLNFPKTIINALCEVGIDYPELCCGILAQLRPL